MKKKKAALIAIISVCCLALLGLSGSLLTVLLNDSQPTVELQTEETSSMNNESNSSAINSGTTGSTSSTTSSENTNPDKNITASVVRTVSQNVCTVKFADNDEVLHNPLMGWQYYAFPEEILTSDIPDGFDIVVIETSWDKLEPNDNEFDWNYLDRSIRKLREEGKTVYLRLYLMPDDVWSIDGTPNWLWTKYNVPYQEVQGALNATGEYNLRHPLYWDKTYQAQVAEFLNAFAAHYKDGAADIIDLRCYGIYGEWDSSWLPFNWGGDTMLKTKTLNELIGLYTNAFGSYNTTRIAINVSSDKHESNEEYKKEAAFDTAMSAGFAIRYDGVGISYDKDLFASQLVNQNFPKSPVFAETYYGFDDTKFSVKNTLKAFLYYRVNGATFGFFKGNYKRMLDQHLDEFNSGLKQMGYRLLPEQIDYPEQISSGKTLTVTSTWKNSGVGVCYNKYPLAVKLVNSAGNTVYKEVDFQFDETSWVKGEDHTVTSSFQLPNHKFLPAGTYTLVISLVDDKLVPAIALPVSTQTNEREYVVGSIKID